MKFAVALMGVLGAAAVGVAGEAKFTAGPTVAKDGAGWTIAFTVSEPTDVEVSVVDAGGRVLRHVAAGMLGGNAPPPLRRDSLAQELTWDGKDDAGRPVPGDGLSVVVRLALRFELDRIIGADPLAIGSIVGLAGDSAGNLYLMDCGDFAIRGSPRVVRLAGDKVAATLLPGPASQPEDRVKDLWMHTAAGESMPRVYHSFQCLYPELAATIGPGMCVAGDQLVFVNNFASVYSASPPRLLRLMAADGVVPPAGFLGPRIRADQAAGAPLELAASPDGRTIYATGLLGPGKWKRDPQNVVLAIDRDGAEPARVLVGESYKAGADETHLDHPAGVATDREGRLYVSDHGNNRVVQYSADGKFQAALPVPAPGPLAVDAKTGAILVAAGTDEQFRGGKLVRFPSIKGPAGGELPLPKNGHTRLAMVCDAAARSLYVGIAFEDRGELWRVNLAAESKLEKTVIAKTPTAPAGGGFVRPMYLAAHPGDDFVLVRDWARQTMLRWMPEKDELAGWQDVADAAIDATGCVYGYTGGYAGNGKITRYDRDGRPWPGADAPISFPGTLRGGHMRGVRGLTVAPNGDLYVLRFKGLQDKDRGWDAVTLDVFAADGKLKKADLVTLNAGAGGVRVDREGNVYVAEHLLPADSQWLDEFKSLGPAGLKVYREITGSVIKFGPGGGATVFYDKLPTPAPEGLPAVGTSWSASGGIGHFRVTGDLKTIYPGIAPVGVGPKGMGCTCYTSRFDLDGFGRLFMPDAARFSVRVLDAAGNQIARVGRYGNADDRDGIRFAWPAYVAVNAKALYVSDMMNRHVVRATMGWQAEAKRPMP